MPAKPTYDELSQKNAALEKRNKELIRFEAAFQSTDDGMALTDLEGKFSEVNAALCALLGYTSAELLQMQVIDLKPPELHKEFSQNLDLVKKQRSLSLETIYLHKDGRPIPIELTVSIVQLEDESLIQIIARDISKRKQREDTLRRYEKIFSVTQDLVAFVDENYIYQMANESYTRDYKTKHDQIVGHSVAELLGDEIFLQTIKPQIDRCLSGELVRYQAWIDYPSIGRRYRDITYYPYRLSNGSVAGIFAVVHDLTDLKLAREAQEAKHTLLSHVLNNTPCGFYVVNKTYDILYCNPTFENNFGLPANRKCYEYIAGREASCPWCKNDKVYSGEPVQWELECPKNGRVYVISESLVENTEYGCAKVAFLADITEQRQVENDLRDHNEQLMALINASPDIICFKDGKGRWLLANETDLQLFQLTGIDYQGKTDAELAPYSDFYRKAFLACMESDEETWKKGKLSKGEEIIPTPDGESKVFYVVKIPLFKDDGSRKGLVVLGHDITELRKKEKRLRHEITARKQASEVMELKSKEVEEANIALRVLLNQQQYAVEKTQQNVLIQLEKAVFPYIHLLRQSLKNDHEKEYLEILTGHLHSVGTSFIKKLSNPDLGLTRKEILVADLVRQGKSTREIAKLLSLKRRSVEAYRNKIRKKLHINNKKIRLSQYLSSNFTSKM